MVVGNLICKEDIYNGMKNDIKVRSCARPTAKDELELAQEAAFKEIKTYEDYYNYPYTLEKLGIYFSFKLDLKHTYSLFLTYS